MSEKLTLEQEATRCFATEVLSFYRRKKFPNLKLWTEQVGIDFNTWLRVESGTVDFQDLSKIHISKLNLGIEDKRYMNAAELIRKKVSYIETSLGLRWENAAYIIREEARALIPKVAATQ